MLQFKNILPNPVMTLKQLETAKITKTEISKQVATTQFKAFADRTTALVKSVINTLSSPQESFYRTSMF